MDELDRQLKELAAIAKAYSPKSLQRNKVMQRLLLLIERSGQLSYKWRGKYPGLYSDALQETRLYIVRKIDTYDPTRGKFMTWVNFKLEREVLGRIKDDTDAQKESQEISLYQPINRDDQESRKTQEDVLSNQEHIFLSDQVRQIIEDDPDGFLKSRYIRGRPDVNLQIVVIYLMNNKNLRKLAENLGVNEQTMYSFFGRSRKELRSYFDRYLKDS
ncbi:MAG: hypothetical protein AAF609_13665 [Cyanobacteria bacterium P01_C01_bin.120]